MSPRLAIPAGLIVLSAACSGARATGNPPPADETAEVVESDDTVHDAFEHDRADELRNLRETQMSTCRADQRNISSELAEAIAQTLEQVDASDPELFAYLETARCALERDTPERIRKETFFRFRQWGRPRLMRARLRLHAVLISKQVERLCVDALDACDAGSARSETERCPDGGCMPDPHWPDTCCSVYFACWRTTDSNYTPVLTVRATALLNGSRSFGTWQEPGPADYWSHALLRFLADSMSPKTDKVRPQRP